MNMQVKFKHINFSVIKKLKKTEVWECRNNSWNEVLGIIKWYPLWRQYCFFTNSEIIYAESCLNDISKFINQLMQERMK